MKVKPLRAKIKKIQSKIDALNAQIKAINNSCPHENIEVDFGSNTGGYDGPNSDTYWLNVKCSDCRWVDTFIDSKDPRYEAYSSRHYEAKKNQSKK